VAVTLADSKGGIVAVLVEEGFDVKDLPVGPPLQATTKEVRSSFRWAHNVTAGKYDVLVSVGAREGTPAIALPLPGNDGHKRYRLGAVEVLPRG
jgi:hypothetical protein